MSRDKQTEIAEMVEDLYDTLETEHIPFFVSDYLTMQLTAVSKQLIAKGYRKSTELAEEIFAEIEERLRRLADESKMLRDKEINLGEKTQLNGEWIGVRLALRDIAELKKKYIGKDINVTTKESEKDDDNT